MSRLLALALVLLPAVAVAQPAQPELESFELGAFLGPRMFSQVSALGWIDSAPGHPMLSSSVELGVRVSHSFMFAWLNPELELAMSPTSTQDTMVNGADIPSVSVLWMEPRVQLRFDPLIGQRVQPFLVVGGGTPIQASSARQTINSGVSVDGYVGAGVRFDTYKGFLIRVDARLSFVPGVSAGTGDNIVGYEGDFSVGVQLALGKKRVHELVKVKPDQDGDGIPDDQDKCPDRAEDKDGFEDQDGCPDIDNDQDGVLDIADKCPTEPETRNGYEDEDGCPDTVPAEIDALKGTIEGLIYGEGETAVHDSARASLQRIVKAMVAHPSIKIVLVGHTDDREANAFATPPEAGQPPPDAGTLATELANARAEAVRQWLVSAGVAQPRILVEGAGAEDAVADNATPKGRFANRRVELKLFIAQP
jgi:outer membrane protein OmpA-like peptidoglycan-associated protein